MTNQIQQDVDDLATLMASGSSLNEYPGYELHPRFADYKNVGKAAENQKARRSEIIERQKNRRGEVFNRQRLMVEDIDEDEEGDEVVMEDHEKPNPFRVHQAPIDNKYKGQLMLSEWLIDIPNELHGKWTMMACPVGKRCLVVAKDGKTKVYSKAGRCIGEFESGVPGGGVSKHGKTILDCIRLDRDRSHFYVLDLIFGSGMSFCDVEASFRFFQVNAIAEEMEINFKKLKSKKIVQFFVPPRCDCNVEDMTKLMAAPMNFDLDGLLFYNNEGYYTPDYTPLVGWLKPWMLPEVINVPVHETYQTKPNDLPLTQFVEDYNEKHNHHYVNGKPWERKKSAKKEKSVEDIEVE